MWVLGLVEKKNGLETGTKPVQNSNARILYRLEGMAEINKIREQNQRGEEGELRQNVRTLPVLSRLYIDISCFLEIRNALHGDWMSRRFEACDKLIERLPEESH